MTTAAAPMMHGSAFANRMLMSPVMYANSRKKSCGGKRKRSGVGALGKIVRVFHADCSVGRRVRAMRFDVTMPIKGRTVVMSVCAIAVLFVQQIRASEEDEKEGNKEKGKKLN